MRNKQPRIPKGRREGGRFTFAEGGILYHGTALENVASIQKSGLRSSDAGTVWSGLSATGVVYATSSRKDAKKFAEAAAYARAEEHGPMKKYPVGMRPDTSKIKVAILKVKIPKSAAKKLREDQNAKVTEGPFAESRTAVRYEFAGDIPPEWIIGVEVKSYE